jgi:uncharacterized protein with FMN-binding domain
MKRAPTVLAATAAGLAATLGFSAHSKAPTTTATATTTTAAPAKSSSSSSSAAAKTATSDAVSTQYGNVQLKVTIAAGKITKIEAVQLPSNDPKSMQIGSYAEPLLRQSALTNQNGQVDAVSGATYTSAGYQTALQSALDKAGFQASVSSTSSAG